jgi:UDP-N-acetylmuramoylalanine--D-glutamate ligase
VSYELRGKRVLVAGAGVTGRAVVAALVDLGAEVTITDGNADRLAEFSVHTETGLTAPPADTDLVITSPGWRPDAPLLAAAAARGIEVINEVELAWRICPAEVTWLGVTGTNGKTTTVSMLESILTAGGRNAVACGNIGLPVIEAVRGGYGVLAVELSSFQLHWSPTVRMHASVVLNVSEDHLDWHGGLEAYAAAKGSIYRGDTLAVVNAEDEWSQRLAANNTHRVGFRTGTPNPGELGVVEDVLVDRAFDENGHPRADHTQATELATLADLTVPGRHNVANALAAAALARAAGVEPSAVAAGLRACRQGEHRAATVAEVDGVEYVDDSKATNPHAALASLTAYEHVVWLAGGLLKGASVDELVAQVAGRLRAVVLIGADAGVIAAALARHAPDVPVNEVVPGDHDPMAVMSEAVATARAMAQPGDTVLLAPSAASMDMFTDYKHRGRAFVEAATALSGGRR